MLNHALFVGYCFYRNLISKLKTEKGTENVAADHLFWIENDETSDDSKVNDNFPGETLMEINTRVEPWFTDFANYLVSDIIPKGMTYQQKNKFFSDRKHCFWEEPYLNKVCFDGLESVRYGVSNVLDTAYWGFLGVGTTHRYAVSSLMDTAYWLSEHFRVSDSASSGDPSLWITKNVNQFYVLFSGPSIVTPLKYVAAE
ncbi:hypothetical protein Tco_0742098, partial [Tanacetum coccineum]